MNYIDEIFLRGNLQQIRTFLLRGAAGRIDPQPYKQQIESAEKRILNQLHERCPDHKEYDEVTALLFEYVGVVEDVYMEIGLQVGGMLTAQVCQNLKPAFEKDAEQEVIPL